MLEFAWSCPVLLGTESYRLKVTATSMPAPLDLLGRSLLTWTEDRRRRGIVILQFRLLLALSVAIYFFDTKAQMSFRPCFT